MEAQWWESFLLCGEGSFRVDKTVCCGLHRKCHFSKRGYVRRLRVYTENIKTLWSITLMKGSDGK